MYGRVSLRDLLKRIIICVVAVCILNSSAISSIYEPSTKKSKDKENPNEILKKIHKEVKDLGCKGKEGFINKEFHVDLDGNKTNREEHIFVLIYDAQDKEKMIVQVTYFEIKNRTIKQAKETKEVTCFIKGDKVEIEKSDYNKKEIKPLLADILKEIRYTKKLLKLIDKKD
ncbi:MAG: hypothetical protein H8E54_12295 [Candidatus Aminicenantes bacterium]|nr:hypothetical protein [Candidatus Aminicenantes bacterium]